MFLNFFNPAISDRINEVHIGQVRLGCVVQLTDIMSCRRITVNKYGHVVGFSRNSTNEILIRVQWEGNVDTSSIHPSNLVIFK